PNRHATLTFLQHGIFLVNSRPSSEWSSHQRQSGYSSRSQAFTPPVREQRLGSGGGGWLLGLEFIRAGAATPEEAQENRDARSRGSMRNEEVVSEDLSAPAC